MLKKISKDISRELKAFLGEKGRKTYFTADVPFLYDNIIDFVSRKSKKIRPILFVLSYLGYSKNRGTSYSNLIRSSLSMELLHDFMLIHDDIIDKSDLRRGKPTVHRLFNKNFKRSENDLLGPNLSIVTGDIIFSLAMEALLSFDEVSSRKEQAIRFFAQTATETAIGEYRDIINDITPLSKVSEKEIYLTYRLKTAKYTFVSPMLTGAMLAGAKTGELTGIEKLGFFLGDAFQIQDDLLDIFSTRKKTGKPIFSDIAESKKTLLIWKTYNTLSSTNKKCFKKIFDKNKKTKKDLVDIKCMIVSSGAHHYCIDKANRLFLNAENICSTLSMKRKHKEELLGFIENLKAKSKQLGI